MLNVPKSAKTQVDRRSNLTYRELVNEYRNRNQPVILTDASKAWLASKTFSFEFFEKRFGDRQIEVEGKVYTLREAIHLLKHSTQETPAPYPIKLNLQDDFAELKHSVEPRLSVTQPDRTHNPFIPTKLLPGLYNLEVFLGGPGGEFPYLHYDYLGLYAFINHGWYHTARSLTLTISVACDQLCQSNWKFFTNECLMLKQYSPLKAKLLRSYLQTVGGLLTAYEWLTRTH